VTLACLKGEKLPASRCKNRWRMGCWQRSFSVGNNGLTLAVSVRGRHTGLVSGCLLPPWKRRNGWARIGTQILLAALARGCLRNALAGELHQLSQVHGVNLYRTIIARGGQALAY
jgi:hypothetical protein